MSLTYVCSPLSAPTRAEMLANAAKASTYMMKAEQEFGGRAVAPHAYLPFLLDDTVPEERALALEFGQKLLAMSTRLVVYGDRISNGMQSEINAAKDLGIPILYRPGLVHEEPVKPVIVGRCVNGVTINGLEYLQNDDGEVLYFNGISAAKSYLHEHGVTDSEMDDMIFRESVGTCKHCGDSLFPSDIDGYKYQCFKCDEDFYCFEQDKDL